MIIIRKGGSEDIKYRTEKYDVSIYYIIDSVNYICL